VEVIIDKVRLSYKEKNSISRLKGLTGLDNWNIFARWGFCYSLSLNDEVIFTEDDKLDVEMTWMVFAGKNFKIYQDLLVQECNRIQLEPTKVNLSKVLRFHLRNGINKMFGQIKDINSFEELIKN
jgi:DNA sulfur modification protein DndE